MSSGGGSEQLAKTACITLDLESDWFVDGPGRTYMTAEYLDEYIELIQSVDVPVSVFVVGRLLEERPDIVERLDAALDCEFHLHSYAHDPEMSAGFRTDLREGIRAFESFFGRRPRGYRAPLGKISAQQLTTLDSEGFRFDSSIFPSYRPGAYNNLDAPTAPYRPAGTEELVELPVGVLPYLRVPTAQSYLKLGGRSYLRLLDWLDLPDRLVFVSHLHDFIETPANEHRSQPMKAIQQRNLAESTTLFQSLVERLTAMGYEFRTIGALYSETVAERADAPDLEIAKS